LSENVKKRPLGTCRRRWEDNIRMVIREIRWKGLERIHLAQDRQAAGSCEHGNEPSGSIKGREFID
jgi:hypothetical protein